MVRKNK